MDYSLGVWAEGVFSLTGECEHHPYSSMLQISSVPEGGDANGIISKWAVTTNHRDSGRNSKSCRWIEKKM